MMRVFPIFLLACGAKNAAPIEPEPSRPALPASACGAAAYDPLPTAEMGALIDIEAAPEWSLDAAGLRGLMTVAGVSDTSVVQHGVRAFRARYRTQDRGEEAEATAILTLPDGATGPLPVLLYLHPTTGFEDFCAPSGRDLTWAAVPLALAGMGFAVAAPDYLGQNGFGEEAAAPHPYLVAEPTALASLDSLRALQGLADDEGESLGEQTLLVGASQGGAAGEWALRAGPLYLPERPFAGAVLSVPPLDLVGWAHVGSQELSVASIGAGFALASANTWHGLGLDLGEVLQPEIVSRLEQTMATECPDGVVPPDITTVEQIYTDDWLAQAASPDPAGWGVWGCLLAESSVGYTAWPANPTVPRLLIFAESDTIALTEVQGPAADRLCEEGAPVEAFTCAGLEHSAAVRATFQVQIDWLLDRVAGAPLGETCLGQPVIACEG